MRFLDAQIPVLEFKFRDYNRFINKEEWITPAHATLTCRNHPTARYSTKNPYQRSLHFLRGPVETPWTECACPFSELVVVVAECDWPVRPVFDRIRVGNVVEWDGVLWNVAEILNNAVRLWQTNLDGNVEFKEADLRECVKITS